MGLLDFFGIKDDSHRRPTAQCPHGFCRSTIHIVTAEVASADSHGTWKRGYAARCCACGGRFLVVDGLSSVPQWLKPHEVPAINLDEIREKAKAEGRIPFNNRDGDVKWDG